MMMLKSVKRICGGGMVVRLALAACLAAPAVAQTCTTQAKMQPELRAAIADTAFMLASAVKAGDAPSVKAATVAAYASNFAGIENAIAQTSAKLADDKLNVTQVYKLDASDRKTGDETEADFSCPLTGSTSETDFGISGLPPGVYAFAMVEATGGPHPWVLVFLLQQDGASWKMAGFYPHARSAAGHDGLWYWKSARDLVKAKQGWLAWMYYGEAIELLRPAGFVSSTQLERLRDEQRSAAPKELADGMSDKAPLVLKSVSGKDFNVSSLTSESASDDKSLRLVMHYAVDTAGGDTGSASRMHEAAVGLIAAHPELKPAFSAVIVFADAPPLGPGVLSLPMSDIP